MTWEAPLPFCIAFASSIPSALLVGSRLLFRIARTVAEAAPHGQTVGRHHSLFPHHSSRAFFGLVGIDRTEGRRRLVCVRACVLFLLRRFFLDLVFGCDALFSLRFFCPLALLFTPFLFSAGLRWAGLGWVALAEIFI
ncbi:hypothetical protein IWZ00DRAFT_373768 [Phyllosticta capitalensis]|uniref:Secreted protein n=1 Tax=Phyllosticta capitalensis TaxID=121624 RepID=A0ABR1YE75_9PEZI